MKAVVGKKHLKAALIGVACCLAIVAPPALAEPVSTPQEIREAQVPAGPLADSLAALSNLFGVNILAFSGIADGKNAPAVSGSLTLEQALGQLLTGSGLEAERSTDGGFVIVEQRAARSDPIQLAPIMVTGEGKGSFTKFSLATDTTSFGVLGERTIMETPFSVSSYSENLFKNTNTRSIGDVLTRDPSIVLGVGRSHWRDQVSIRGLTLHPSSVLYDGVAGLVHSDGYRNPWNLERIDLLRGSTVFNGGAAIQGSAGGAISLVPKRPTVDDLNEIMVGYEENGSPMYGVDFSRRFGDGKQFGVRFSGFMQPDGGNIDRFSKTTENYAMFLQWQPHDRLTLGYEFNRFQDRSDGYRDELALGAGVTDIPDAPDNATNYAQPWSFVQEHGQRHYASLEYEFEEHWKLTARGGFNEGDDGNGYYSVFGTVTDDAGTFLLQNPFRAWFDQRDSYGALVRMDGEFVNENATHRVSAGWNYAKEEREARFASGTTSPIISNIYDPVYVDEVGIGASGPVTHQDTELNSYMGTYELLLMDERLSLLGGARHVNIEYSFGSSTDYDDSALSPFGAVSFKPTKHSTIYFSYSESLERGPNAPGTAVNANEALEPITSKQFELGGKYDLGGAIASAAVFQSERPLAGLNAGNVFEELGDQRFRGVEFRLEGEVIRGVRLIGGFTYLDAEIDNPTDDTIDGNTPVGVPEWVVSLYGEADVPAVQGLTLNGGFRYEGERYADNQNSANRLVDDSYKFDVGLQYRSQVGGVPLTTRLFVDNVTDERYWGVADWGGLILSAPRRVGMTMTVNF